MKLKRITACMLAGALTMSTVLTGCGSIDADATGATLGDQEISLGFMNFMAKYQQAYYDVNYAAFFGTDMWTTEISDGTTMTDSVKDSVSESIETMYLLEQHMEDYGVELTQDDLDSIQEAAETFMSDNSSKAIKQIGATQEYVEEMLRLYTIQSRMKDAIYAETDTEVSDEEAAQRTFSYIRASVTSGTDEDGNSYDYDEDQQTEFQAQMKLVAADAKEDFDAAAEEDDNLESNTYSYGSDESDMDEAVIEAADALSEGEVSDLITTDDYYYILRLDSEFDEEATESKKESIASQRQSDHYDEVCDGYKEDAEYVVNEKAWAKVTFDKLFTAVESDTEE